MPFCLFICFSVSLQEYASATVWIFLMGEFYWNQPSNRLYDSRVGCKSHGIGYENHKKARKNDGAVTSSRQNIGHTVLSGSRSGPQVGVRIIFLHDKMRNYHDKPLTPNRQTDRQDQSIF